MKHMFIIPFPDSRIIFLLLNYQKLKHILKQQSDEKKNFKKQQEKHEQRMKKGGRGLKRKNGITADLSCGQVDFFGIRNENDLRLED